MIGLDELPEGAGLFTFGDDGWKQTAKPKFCKGWELTGRDLMRLIMGKWGTYADMLPATDL